MGFAAAIVNERERAPEVRRERERVRVRRDRVLVRAAAAISSASASASAMVVVVEKEDMVKVGRRIEVEAIDVCSLGRPIPTIWSSPEHQIVSPANHDHWQSVTGRECEKVNDEC